MSLREHSGEIVFAVTDHGPGVAKEHEDKVFSSYWQVENSASQGTGLGLAITKGIVEAHGGSVGVESIMGDGSTFYFSLPLS